VQRAIAATLPFLAVPRTDLESVRAELSAWNPSAEGIEPNAPLAVRLQPQLRLYLLGLLSSRLGDQRSASTFAAGMERMQVPAEARDVIRGLVQALRADMALESGRAAESGQALDQIRGGLPLELVNMPAFANVREYGLEHARYLRVLQLYAAQQDAEALRWMETGFQGSPAEMLYLAPLHLQRAQIYERTGERAKATEQYRRFVNLWGSCDASLRPRVDQAKSRLAQLERERG
jgi:hypothetical protein